ncbi:hypothetical protein [Olleya sp. R77988]|uniref:hypothetical protein n=1 Tax=Olleya sp. R77988 TaxID=3093875 RepID=UPI0037CB62AF
MKYKITNQDLEKRSYGLSFKSFDNNFLHYIENQQKLKNPVLSDVNIDKLEKTTLKNINQSIVLFSLFGLLSSSYGLYILFNYKPRLAVNLYTQFPLIENGSIPIVLGLACLVGCVYSYLKRDAILVTKVKSKLIEDLKKEKQEKDLKSSSFVSKKQKRFRQKFTGHKKRNDKGLIDDDKVHFLK